MRQNVYNNICIYMFSGRITEDISKTAKDAAGSIADKGQRLGQTSAFRTISQVKCKKSNEIHLLCLYFYLLGH